jgi:CRISPR-associated protein Cmr1
MKKKLEYTVRFNNPAFLGNAEQQAQWRTPPFKTLLRQWWRVVKAPQVRFNVDALRSAENELFGAASDDGEVKSHRSRVQLRLSHWDDGKMTQWPANEPSEFHGEVGESGRRVGTDLYLGFGPLENDRDSRSTQFGKSKSSGQKRTAIDEKAKATLSLMLSSDYEAELCAAMQLAAWFGTVGSRSRNGWGALQMAHDHLKPLTRADLESLGVTRRLSECLGEEWPHAIGKDDSGPLVWKTKSAGDWRAVMKELARIKIAFRTQPEFSLHGVSPGQFAVRHLLAYPVTHHPVNGAAWGGQGRLSNQVRFKLAKSMNGQLEGIIVHLPCALPRDMAATLGGNAVNGVQIRTWQAVHAVLDQLATRLK